MRSKVLSEMVKSAWPPNIAASIGSLFFSHSVIKMCIRDSTNDVHGAVDGYAYIAQLKADYEAKGAEVILVDAGDYRDVYKRQPPR